jgi:hypothetical protein
MYAATHVNSSTGSFLTQWSGSRSRTASKLYLNLPHHVTEAQINAHWLSACPAYFGGRRGLPGCATCQQYGEHREVCVLRMEWGIGCALTISCFMVVWSSASRPEDGSLCTISTRISFLADTTPLRSGHKIGKCRQRIQSSFLGKACQLPHNPLLPPLYPLIPVPSQDLTSPQTLKRQFCRPPPTELL